MLRIRRGVWGMVCGVGVLCLPMAQAESISAMPSRPNVASSAQLSAPGHFELESGYLRIRESDDATRTSFPVRLKYAFNENLGLLIDHEAAVGQRDGVAKRQGAGDTVFQVKFKLPGSENDAAVFGLEAGVMVPTARDDLGVGKPAYLINGIYSAALGDYSFDINLGATRLNSVDAGEDRTGWNWAAAVSRDVTDKLGVIGEFSGSGRGGTASQSHFLAALTYSVSRKLVLDGGMSWGLNKAAPDWMMFAGLTLLLDARQ